MLSGLYAHRHGVLDNFTDYPNDLPSFPKNLQAAGYGRSTGRYVLRLAAYQDDFGDIEWDPEEEMEFQFPVSVTGKIRRRRSLATEEFAYARGKTSKPLKMTLPSPLILGASWSPSRHIATRRLPNDRQALARAASSMTRSFSCGSRGPTAKLRHPTIGMFFADAAVSQP